MNSVDADIATGEMRVNEFKEMKSINADDFTVPERLLEKDGRFFNQKLFDAVSSENIYERKDDSVSSRVEHMGCKGCGKALT